MRPASCTCGGLRGVQVQGDVVQLPGGLPVARNLHLPVAQPRERRRLRMALLPRRQLELVPRLSK